MLMGFLPLGGLCLYTLLMEFYSLESVKADMPTGALSAILPKLKLFAVGFFSLEVPHYIVGIFPS